MTAYAPELTDSGWEVELIPSDGYLHTGIRNLGAAKRYLRRKFNRGILEPLQRRLGARFYVTARQGPKSAFLLGPYASHMIALMNVSRAESLLRERYPLELVAVGTASAPESRKTVFGR